MDPSRPVRVRFAPSPTGFLHVGNARTALFNWLYARRHGGAFILRVEDTDVERSEARFEAELIADLQWMGLQWDEGPDVGGEFAPYRQSDRSELYREQAQRLLAEGSAYRCFCSAEELAEERESAVASHQPQKYSGKCRDLGPAEAERRVQAGEAAAIRLRIPAQPIKFHDIVHGPVEFSSDVVGDPIIVRSSGVPVYNFVVVVDDALMKVTHVIRGDDHLSNTPRQVALYSALGWPVPEFAHLSTILGEDRERLSKRHGATSIQAFREMGVLPEALVNYLALLGWAPAGGNRETFNCEELQKEFSLERVTPAAAIFDMAKLYWLNRHYLKLCTPQRVRELALPFFVKTGLMPGDQETDAGAAAGSTPRTWLDQVLALLLPSVDRLEELPERAAFIFEYDPAASLEFPENREVLQGEKTAAVIESFSQRVRALPEGAVTPEIFKELVNQVKVETGAKGKELFHPIRIVVTGTHSGPEFDKLVPILETGSKLPLPRAVMSVKARVEAFGAAWQAGH